MLPALQVWVDGVFMGQSGRPDGLMFHGWAGAGKGGWNETPGSAMFTYLLCRCVERGLIPKDKFGPVIGRAYKGLLTKCVRNTDGFYNLIDRPETDWETSVKG